MREHFVNEQTVMQYYIAQMDADNINFLQGKETKKKVIRSLIEELMTEEKMNYKIQIACKLWKELFEVSMSFISPDKQGYDKLFKYFDAYVEFEELIFASDSFYRDHTLHCIWVYFLGEYIKKNEKFADLFVDEEAERITLSAIDEVISPVYFEEGGMDDFKAVIDMIEDSFRYDEAMRCVAALTHDLGYPLKKIEKINKSIKKVLPYFAINDFEDFTFEYSNVQQEFVNEFLEFLSRKICINMNTDKKAAKVLGKIFKLNEYGTIVGIDHEQAASLSEEERKLLAGAIHVNVKFRGTVATKVGFMNDFEDYKHGIMSAFLMFKNLRACQYVDYNKLKDELSTSKHFGSTEVLAIQSILASISNHTNDMFRISQLTSDEYLTFVDELEEFSRISRASQNREYVKEFCDTALYMEDGWLNIVFEFSNSDLDNLDPEISFKGRCKRFLSLFDIKELSPNLKLRVSCIGKLPNNQNIYVLEIASKHAKVMINGEAQNIPKYLKSNQFYTSEEYAAL